MKSKIGTFLLSATVAAAMALAGPVAMAGGRGGHSGGGHGSSGHHGGGHYGGHYYGGGRYYRHHGHNDYWAWGLGLGLAAAVLTRPYYYAPPPVVYAPPRVVYAPPQVVYTPPVQITQTAPAAPACVSTREYRTTVLIDGQPVEATGLACLQQNGNWITLRGGAAY